MLWRISLLSLGFVSSVYADQMTLEQPQAQTQVQAQSQAQSQAQQPQQTEQQRQEEYLKLFRQEMERQGFEVKQTSEGLFVQDMRSGMTWKVVNNNGRASLQPVH